MTKCVEKYVSETWSLSWYILKLDNRHKSLLPTWKWFLEPKIKKQVMNTICFKKLAYNLSGFAFSSRISDGSCKIIPVKSFRCFLVRCFLVGIIGFMAYNYMCYLLEIYFMVSCLIVKLWMAGSLKSIYRNETSPAVKMSTTGTFLHNIEGGDILESL